MSWRHWLVRTLVVMALVTVTARVESADDGNWGHLAGRFVFDGPRPVPKKLPVTKDQSVFGDEITDESLLVHETNRGVANVLVYLLPENDGELRVHPAYAESANAKVELATENGRFVPHVLLMRTSQTMIQCNKDHVAHSVHLSLLNNPPVSPRLPVSDREEFRYDREERLPSPVACNVYPWMRGFILLRSNPYMAKSDSDGRFMIENLAVGRHVFRLWHERVGYLRDVKCGSTDTDAKGRLTLTIRAGPNQLDDVRLSPHVFQPPR